MEKTYGADRAAVEAKIARLRFDWKTFDPDNCSVIYGIPTPVDPSPTLCTEVELDFSVAANNARIMPGSYVASEWAEYGLTLSAAGGYGNRPRVFDTSNPGKDNSIGDPDLGAPNNQCNPPGPGVGDGGKPGQKWQNCEPLGNVLIVQEKNDLMNIPDDNMDGGTIVFNFNPPAEYVSKIGLLDVDYETEIIVLFSTDSGRSATRKFNVPIRGDNSHQVLSIDTPNVTQLTLVMERSGAVSSISFCYNDRGQS